MSLLSLNITPYLKLEFIQIPYRIFIFLILGLSPLGQILTTIILEEVGVCYNFFDFSGPGQCRIDNLESYLNFSLGYVQLGMLPIIGLIVFVPAIFIWFQFFRNIYLYIKENNRNLF